MFSEDMKHILPFVGTYVCRNDGELTLLSDAESLAGLTGYGAAEWDTVLHRSLAAMVDDGTREKLLEDLAAQLADGDRVECVMPIRSAGGGLRWVLNRGVCIREAGMERICGVLVDITHLKNEYDIRERAASALRRKAENDSLTNIYNAAAARRLAEEFIQSAEGRKATLLIIDLDDFKRINDRYGHMMGDAVLVQTAQIIKRLFRNNDIVGRIGGEEFMVMMKDTDDRTIIERRCSKLNADLQELSDRLNLEEPLSCSIGIGIFPASADSYFRLFCSADRALYCAKDRGKKRFAFFDSVCDYAEDGMPPRFLDYDENMLRGYITPDALPGTAGETCGSEDWEG